MVSTRIKGRALRLTLGGEDVWADLTKAELNNEEGGDDVVTFADAAEPGGGRLYYIDMSAIQSTDPTSFWSRCWEQSGEDVPFAFAPHGNETPTAAQPHFIGTCTIGARPKIGGEAGRSTTYTFDTRFDVVGIPTLDTGA